MNSLRCVPLSSEAMPHAKGRVTDRVVELLEASDRRVHRPVHHLVARALLGHQHDHPLGGQPHGDIAEAVRDQAQAQKTDAAPPSEHGILRVFGEEVTPRLHRPELFIENPVTGLKAAGSIFVPGRS